MKYILLPWGIFFLILTWNTMGWFIPFVIVMFAFAGFMDARLKMKREQKKKEHLEYLRKKRKGRDRNILVDDFDEVR